MTGHLALPGQDGDLPASLSAAVLRDLLRGELRFEGVTVTDALDMRALAQGSAQIVDAIVALRAGEDLLLGTADEAALERLEEGIAQAQRRGLIDADDDAAATRRLDELRRWLGGYDQPPLDVVGCDDHQALAAELARRSLTLVRNDDRLLPLRPAADARIAVVQSMPADLTPADTSSTVPPTLARRFVAGVPGVEEILLPAVPGEADIAGLGERLGAVRPRRRRDVLGAPPAGTGGAGRGRPGVRQADRHGRAAHAVGSARIPVRPHPRLQLRHPAAVDGGAGGRAAGRGAVRRPVAGRHRRPPSTRSRAHGMGLRDEILEQPAAARRLLDSAPAAFAPIAAAVASRRPRFAVIAARGTSDNAGIYAQYLLAIRNGMIVALAAPSTITLYGARPNMADALVVGISQSGRSPDIVAVVDEARRQGALTVAMTNDPDSPLAETADHVVDLRAGPELATAATKTYTTELLAAALLSTALDPPSPRGNGRPGRPARADVGGARRRSRTRATWPPRTPTRQRAVVLGRGYSYATAREWALKLQEMALVAAMPYSAADFEHGPLALAEPGLPVLAVAPSGPELDAQVALLTRLKEDHGARLLVLSDAPAAREIDEGLALPGGIPPWLAPIVEILPAQLYAYHLTVARGLDPEHPRSINKVTETR